MTTQYAINVSDLTTISEIEQRFLVAPVIQNRQIVNAEPSQVAGAAVILNCDEPRSLAIIEVLRKKYPRKNLLRIYRKTHTAWVRY